MAIIFKMEANGGFVCGDTETGLTAYAYPTSQNASDAKHNAANVATRMLSTRKLGDTDHSDYDKRNWGRLYPGIALAYSQCPVIQADKVES